MGTINSGSLCTVAKDMFFASTPFIPESFFCAMSVDDGKGDSEKINDAAEAWGDASKQLREFHDELASVAHSVPDAEWKAADREAYEQQINKYLEQVTISATAAETASVLLYAVEAALYVYAAFALAEATVVAVNAAAIAVADCTIVGAPEAEAEGAAAGAEAYEALETAAKVLMATLSGIAAAMEAGVIVDMGVQAVQGDSAALSDFGHATLTGAVADAKMLPNEALDYAKGKVLKGLHDSSFGDGGESGGSGDDGSDGSEGDGGSDGSDGDGSDSGSTAGGSGDSSGHGSGETPNDGSGEAPKDGSDGSGDTPGDGSGDGSKDGSGETGGDGGKDGSSDSKEHEWIQPVGNDPLPKQIRSFFPEVPE